MHDQLDSQRPSPIAHRPRLVALGGCDRRVRTRRRLIPVCLMMLTLAVGIASGSASGQDADATDFVDAINLIPDSAAGVMRIPNMPKFCDALEETHAGKLREEELVKPFFDAQRERIRDYLQSVNNKIAITPEDLYDIASGEVALAWLPFPNDKRRPYSLAVIADVRGRRDKANAAMAKIDDDLKEGKWTRRDVTYQGETVRIYDAKRKPGQIKVDQIAITLNDQRIISADRDSVVTGLLDAIAGNPSGKPISTGADFKAVLSRAGQAIQQPVKDQGGTLAAEWFARPFAMGRIVREALDVDRGNDIDIIQLLENQGFGAVKSAGGVIAINGEKYDMLHKGVILATKPFQNAAKMLQFDAGPREPIPAWVPPDAASFNRLKIKIEEAFWASGSLVDEALGDEIFDDMINDIHKDKNGPQIDIKNNVLPSMDDEVILISDNVLPADVDSERMLVAIRLNNAEKLRIAIQKAMEVEPDASKLDVSDLSGIDVWQVEQSEGGDESFDEELFGLDDFEDDFEEVEEAPPLLDKWAIAVVPQGKGSKADYLIFSSHADFLVSVAKRIQTGVNDGFATLPEIKRVVESLEELGIEKPIFDRVVRTKLSMRIKYELLRQNKLRESDSILAKLVQRVAEENEEDEESDEPDSLNGETLPPIAKIEEYLPDGGSYLEETDDGWITTGFLLK